MSIAGLLCAGATVALLAVLMNRGIRAPVASATG
jgi:hypothetical protein